MGSTCARKQNTDPGIELKNYRQIKVKIASYTKGLKTQIKDVMNQTNVGGFVYKTLYEDVSEIYSTPIHTEVIAGGTEFAINEFQEISKEIVEEGIDFDIEPYPSPELTEKEKLIQIIKPTDKRIANRKGSDAGEKEANDENLLNMAVDNAVLITNKAKNKAKQVLNVVSNIPILSQYANEMKDQWSITIKEMPKVIISAKSLFHPYSVCSFAMYSEDSPSVLRVCLEWRLSIPYDVIELYTKSGIPLKDSYTLFKEMECIFVDTRITKQFFEKEEKLKSELSKITEEPFVYHQIALHGMTMDYLIGTLGIMKDKRAQEILQNDLGISGVDAVMIIKFIRNQKPQSSLEENNNEGNNEMVKEEALKKGKKGSKKGKKKVEKNQEEKK